jgi:hypothetical protein
MALPEPDAEQLLDLTEFVPADLVAAGPPEFESP